MKKIIFSLLTAAILIGCTDTVEETGENNAAAKPREEPQMTQKTNNYDEEPNDTQKEESEEGYKELAIQDHFNPEDYESHLVTDNPGSRVFIFHDGKRPVYKTVYIKPDNRLKVINLTTDELLTNERI